MTALLYGIIQTMAYNNRFELGPNQPTDEVAVFASVHHPNQVALADDGENFMFRGSRNQAGLIAAFPQWVAEDCLSVPHAPNDITDHLELIGKMFTVAAELPPDPGEPATPITESIARVNFWGQPPAQGEISYCLALFYIKFILARRICPKPSVGGTGTGVCSRQALNGGSVGGSVPGGSW